ncbi:uncharacterized protein BJX67DRAFT_320103 [Aspergillus lucknowensis]|uniref:Uncharacterized protein n=1 Tax=Aspergillus lucknowensis TaxID=176173 RepID=A0ABR4LZT2_9EURO
MDDKHGTEGTSQSRSSLSAMAEGERKSSPSNSSSSSLAEQAKEMDQSPQPALDENAGGDVSSPDESISGVPLFMVMFGVTLVIFLMLLDTSIVATAVPKITNHFHSLQDVAWYGSAYTLARYAEILEALRTGR